MRRYPGRRVDKELAKRSGTVRLYNGMPLILEARPEHREQLLQRAEAYRPGSSEKLLKHYFEPISREHLLPRQRLRPRGLVSSEARHHPRAIGYRAPAVSRAIAHVKEHPTATLTSFGAAALYGLHYFVDSADTVLLSTSHRSDNSGAREPAFRTRYYADEWTLFLDDQPLRVVPPTMTVASCLRAVLKEEHSWDVPTIAGLSPKEIRAIQLIDAVRHTFGFTQGDIVTGCSRFIQARLCARLVAHSSADAESPPETLARLIVSHVAKRSNLEIAEQVEVYDGDRLVTRLDCALVKVKIAIMYDGKHHLNRFQRDKDAEITLDLNQQGWKVIRVTAGTLNQLESRLVRLLDRR